MGGFSEHFLLELRHQGAAKTFLDPKLLFNDPIGNGCMLLSQVSDEIPKK
jgi:hypothetical protein